MTEDQFLALDAETARKEAINMPNVRQAMFPYGMAKNPDGTWTLFNRQYKPVGVTTPEWAEWDDPRHKITLKGLGPATLAKLDCRGNGVGDRIYFYNDGCNPGLSSDHLAAYFARLKILIGLQSR